MNSFAGMHSAFGKFTPKHLKRKAAGQGRGGPNGGSDPGLWGLRPPQTYPCSYRRSGGRSRRNT